ncbi:conjugal transfer protein TraG N-terminal domain-containing protein [Geoalkalibacter halelectricus]|uniref:conjugal transfer protein TraG N-terminal domain-containing protein n=1 Tax=Geoalkalibacter halelectricus TaxID=2847045 RepID=UPI003D1CE633
MRTKTIGLSLLLVMLLATGTFAAPDTVEYYTFDGFQPITDAFRKLSLIFSASAYTQMAALALGFGVIFGGIAFYIQHVSGAKASPVGFILPILLGVGVWFGLFAQTATVIVYDAHTNQFDPIPNVPIGIAYTAYATNKVERGLIEILDMANPPNMKIDQIAGGNNIAAMGKIMQSAGSDANLKASLAAYIRQCVMFELTHPATTFSFHNLMTGNDARVEFAKAQNPAVFTQIYSTTHPAGKIQSCDAAWNHINTQLSNPVTYQGMLESAAGFFGIDSSDAAQFEKFRHLVGSFIQGPLNQAGVDHVDVARQSLVANVLFQVIQEGDPAVAMSIESSRKLSTSGMGAFISAQEWIPVLKSVITAVAITLISFLALFIPTPLVGRALSIIFGLFAFLMAWAITDAVITSGAGYYYMQVMREARESGLGLQTILNFPSYEAKVLSMYGMVRSAGIMLAGFITMMLVRVGGHFMAGMAGNLMGAVQGAGAQSGALATPEGSAASRTGLLSAAITDSWYNSGTFESAGGFGSAVTAGVNQQAYGMGRGLGLGAPMEAINSGEFDSSLQTKTALEKRERFNQEPGGWQGGVDEYAGHQASSTYGVFKGEQNQGGNVAVETAARAQAEQKVAAGVAADNEMTKISTDDNPSTAYREQAIQTAETTGGHIMGYRATKSAYGPDAVRDAATLGTASNAAGNLGKGGSGRNIDAAMAQSLGKQLMEFGKTDEVINGLVGKHFGGDFEKAGAVMGMLQNAQTMGGVMSAQAFQGWAAKEPGLNLSTAEAATLLAAGQKLHYTAGATGVAKNLAEGAPSIPAAGEQIVDVAATGFQKTAGSAQAAELNATFANTSVADMARREGLHTTAHAPTTQEVKELNAFGAGKKNWMNVTPADNVAYTRDASGAINSAIIIKAGSQDSKFFDTNSNRENSVIDKKNVNRGDVTESTYATPAGLASTVHDASGNLLMGTLDGTVTSKTVKFVHDEGDGTDRAVVATTTSSPDGQVGRERLEGGTSRDQHENSERWHAGYRVDGVFSGWAGEVFGDTAKRGVGGFQSILKEAIPIGGAIKASGASKSPKDISTDLGKRGGAQYDKAKQEWGEYYKRAGWNEPGK